MQSILYPCIIVSFIIPSASERPNGKLRIPLQNMINHYFSMHDAVEQAFKPSS